ncbi:glycosyltransferase [Mucilaginibacter sp. UYCu711]|uniref:glycosyltransferase n=1 Tax=Mucilaginibacter sp. UYCu711 TaxID=3156339 RepID=UPI003D260E57
MRILHFTESFSQPTETFIKRFIQKSCQFAKVGVVSFNFQNIDKATKKQVIFFEITGSIYTRKNLKGAYRYLYEKLTSTKHWYSQLNNAIETFKPDIIHCHFGNAGVHMMEFNRIFKKHTPYITSFYGYDISSQPTYDKQYRKNLVQLLKHGNAFFAEGPELKKKIMAFGASEKKCLVNPLLIPVEDYPVKEKYRSANDPIKFLFIGRFVEKKGFHLFLKAIAQLREKLNEFTIDIIGNGPLQENYNQIITENNLQSFVKWHGLVKHHNIIKMMSDYDFLIHPSMTAKDNDSEGGAPTIIIEAQALGLPIITSSHADIPYVMGYHDFLAEENDLNSLMQVIEKIAICGNIQYYTKKGAEHIKAMHDLQLNTSYEANLKKLAIQ